uniref:hypothetical protein n=1 Tax=Enterobacter hormaechei TaxID=158836 RepID=UPI0013D0807E
LYLQAPAIAGPAVVVDLPDMADLAATLAPADLMARISARLLERIGAAAAVAGPAPGHALPVAGGASI